MPPRKSKGGGKGKTVVVDVPKCANVGCANPGSQKCGGCKRVLYCSAACQKVHWKQGGHKQACIPVAQVSSSPAQHAAAHAPATQAGAGAMGRSDANACFICLGDDEPLPIQSGCACRGDAGLAHVECRAEDAAHRTASRSEYNRWFTCGTCGQLFTGAMKCKLAEAWWSTAQRLPKEDDQRLAAAMNLANSLRSQGKFTEAETMHRETLEVQRRMLGPEHPDTLGTAINLANTLNDQHRYTDAETMYREVLVVKRKKLGPKHPDTLGSATNLANSLNDQGKYPEAEALHREVLAAKKRVLGPEHPHTLMTAYNLALSLEKQGRYAEAEAMHRKTLPVWRRVLGPEHPTTLGTINSLATAIESQGRLAEAEAMFRETHRDLRRVLGAEHPNTLMTGHNLISVLFSQGKFAEATTLSRDILAVERRALGPTHPTTVLTAENLAMCVARSALTSSDAKK
jgi:tetratricopeptide (TPR) repeat protein